MVLAGLHFATSIIIIYNCLGIKFNYNGHLGHTIIRDLVIEGKHEVNSLLRILQSMFKLVC